METTVRRMVRRALHAAARAIKTTATQLELMMQEGCEVRCACGRIASVVPPFNTKRVETMCPVCLHKLQQQSRPPVRTAVPCETCGAPAVEFARSLTHPQQTLAASCKACSAKMRAGKVAS
jgi:hypothetical protein